MNFLIPLCLTGVATIIVLVLVMIRKRRAR